MIIEQCITVMLVDDHAMIREGYRSLLKKQPRLEVIAEAADGAEAYLKFKQYQPDLVIMDLSLPKQGGLETITRIKRQDPAVKILVFSMHLNPLFALQAIKAGALGYVTKSSTPTILIEAIYTVYAGDHILSPDMAQSLALEKTGHEYIALQSLSTREFEIFRMLAESHSKQEISLTLNISPKTVSNCHYLIKNKLNVSSDIELIYLAIRMNVINLFEPSRKA
ncbi:MAG: response regulator transcription factor [Proteobacteria bacterium]|nr:response regulator transcription factor [Pseudomonadota bacterium]